MPEILIQDNSLTFEQVSHLNIIASLLFAAVLSAVMYFTFREIHNSMTYDSTFNSMLVMLSMITTIIMIIIAKNVAMSLGMVGSLSLVRFRTNVKDNRDIGFVFWAMLIGLAASTRAYVLGTLGSLLLAGILILTSKKLATNGAMLLVIRGRSINTDLLTAIIDKFTSTNTMKAQNLLDNSFELVFEFKSSPEQQTRMAEIIKEYEGVDSVNILAPSADMTA